MSFQAEPDWKRAELLPGHGKYAEKNWGPRDVGREEAGDCVGLSPGRWERW